MTLSDAIIAAARLHAGQLDKGGAPYILHPLRVMLACADDEEQIAAVLHDAAEDAGWARLEAELAELPPWLREALDALTRRAGESYDAFIVRLAPNPIARAVKLADLADNLDLTRIPNPSEEDRRRCEKYAAARQLLLDADRVARFGWTEEDFAPGGGVRFE